MFTIVLNTKTGRSEEFSGSIDQLYRILCRNYDTKKRAVTIYQNKEVLAHFALQGGIEQARLFLTRKSLENTNTLDLNTENYFNIGTIVGK